MIKVQPAVITKKCTLSPGLIIDGKPITECTVKLLTRHDQTLIAYEKDPDKRDALFFTQSVASLGDLTDGTLVLTALDELALVDEIKIRQTIAELEQEHLQPAEVEKPRWYAVTRTSDIVSEPFAINGFEFGGKWQRSCVVRLIRRGEWKRIQEEPDPVKREDLILLYTIVQIGDVLKVTREHIDCLLETDVELINQEVEALRERNAPRTKSTGAEEAGG